MQEASRAGDAAPLPTPPLPLIGRRRELRALAALLARGNRVLVLGPRGMGKTRLASEAFAASGILPLAVRAPAALHPLLEQICCELFPPGEAAAARRLASPALQTKVLRQLRLQPRWLWIDDPLPAGPRLFRFLERLIWIDGCGLLVTAASRSELGMAGRLLWDPCGEIVLRPLARPAAARLLEEAIRICRLERLGPLEDFRARTLAAAAGNPGCIVTLCRLAVQPQYWRGGRLLFAPLWIDTLTQMA
ncbi:MAG: AAA family ATPase [Bryobacteraceae bacterium]|nr:AAA family ATPase [Bryobacteraceae bacterium]MCX7605488.1 AAA family ATPase [Bryobacteraceae bacterium]